MKPYTRIPGNIQVTIFLNEEWRSIGHTDAAPVFFIGLTDLIYDTVGLSGPVNPAATPRPLSGLASLPANFVSWYL